MTSEAARKRYVQALVLGGISAALYGSVVLMPLFLVPVQISARRKGFRSMMLSAIASTAAIAIWQLVLMGRAGMVSMSTILLGISVPAAMLLGLVLIAWPRFDRVSFVPRALLAAAVASGISLPSIMYATGDPTVKDVFIETFSGAANAIGGSGIDYEAIWTMVRTGVLNSFGAMLFLFLFTSVWIGTRLGARNMPEQHLEGEDGSGGDAPALPPKLALYSVPAQLVWVLLASWAGLLLNRFFASNMFSAVALNVALALSICYGVQGFAVANTLAERVGLAPALRFLAPIALVLLIASGTAGLVAVGILALLGTLETWIPFRAVTTKGGQP